MKIIKSSLTGLLLVLILSGCADYYTLDHLTIVKKDSKTNNSCGNKSILFKSKNGQQILLFADDYDYKNIHLNNKYKVKYIKNAFDDAIRCDYQIQDYWIDGIETK